MKKITWFAVAVALGAGCTPIPGKTGAQRVSDALRCYSAAMSNAVIAAKAHSALGEAPTSLQKLEFVESVVLTDGSLALGDACAAAAANFAAVIAERQRLREGTK